MKPSVLILLLFMAGCYSRPATKSYNATNKMLLGIPNNSKMKIGLVPKLSAHLITPKKYNELMDNINPHLKMIGSMKYMGSDKKYHYYIYQQSGTSFRSMYKVLKTQKTEPKEMPVTSDETYWQWKSLTFKQIIQNRRNRISGSGNTINLSPHTRERLLEQLRTIQRPSGNSN